MSDTIRTSVEKKRGCGYRQPGGTYLMAGQPGEPCDLLPIEMASCPVCGEGVKPSRSWTWVEGNTLLGVPSPHGGADHQLVCPLARRPGLQVKEDDPRCGLLWIGSGFYDTPAAFMREAQEMGISRRISALPRDYDPECPPWVLLAHREAIKATALVHTLGGDPPPPTPGVFSLFRPERVEYVVRGDEDDQALARLRQRGIEPVRVVRDEDQGGLL